MHVMAEFNAASYTPSLPTKEARPGRDALVVLPQGAIRRVPHYYCGGRGGPPSPR